MNNCKQEIEMTLTQHAHSQHKGVHGVGQTSSSPPRPWRKHHFLRLGLLTFYLWMEHKRFCLSGLATNKTIYCIKEQSNSNVQPTGHHNNVVHIWFVSPCRQTMRALIRLIHHLLEKWTGIKQTLCGISVYVSQLVMYRL